MEVEAPALLLDVPPWFFVPKNQEHLLLVPSTITVLRPKLYC
jgi:hypothetical protein